MTRSVQRWVQRSIGALLCLGGVLLAPAAWAQGGAPQRATAYATAPDIPYDSVPNFLKFPADVYLGEGIGVATNSKGHIFVYTRGGQTSQLFEFDPTGKYLREIGKGLYGFAMAHGVRVDPQDNIWVVDEGTNMVIKFTPEGRVAMVLGRRPESHGLPPTPAATAPQPPAVPYLFDRPTDVAWDAAGNIFIADGYGNSRVVKYDKDGMFVKAVGNARGSEPTQMNTPHSIATDAHGNVYVADRGNRRVQVFSNDLTLRALYPNVGAPWAVCISPGPHQYLFSANSNPDNNNSLNAAVSGEIYKMELDGTVVGKFGQAGKPLKDFSTVHAIDCRNPNELLVAEITAWRVQKIRLQPTPTTAAR